MGRAKPTSPSHKARENRAATSVSNKSEGTKSQKHPYRKDCADPNRSEQEVIREAQHAVLKHRQDVKSPNSIPSAGSSPIPGLPDDFTSRLLDNGIKKNQILAACVLASGASYSVAGDEAKVKDATVRTWFKTNIAFRALVDHLTLQMEDSGRADALREMYRQLRQDPARALSDKDIFDWVKLALSQGSAASSGRGRPSSSGNAEATGAAGPSILHQHLHVHGKDNPTRHEDDSGLVNLQAVSRDLDGEKRRQLAMVLREGNEQTDES